MKVNYDELLRILAFISDINNVDSKEIEWHDDAGKPIAVDPESLKKFSIIGLSNKDIVKMFDLEIDNNGNKSLKMYVEEYRSLDEYTKSESIKAKLTGSYTAPVFPVTDD